MPSSVDWDRITDKGDVIPERGDICYASLFSCSHPGTKQIRSFYSTENLELAEWFRKEVIDKFVPDRLRLAYGWTAGHDGKDVSSYDETPWGTLTIDTTVASAVDVYLLLCIFRYPHEQDRVVYGMREYIDKGMDLVSAFVNSHAYSGNLHHTCLNENNIYGKVGEKEVHKNFNFKMLWEKFPKVKGNDVPYYRKCDKIRNVTEFFPLNNDVSEIKPRNSW